MGAGVAKSKEEAYLESPTSDAVGGGDDRVSLSSPATPASPKRGSVLDKDEDDEAPEFLTCPLSFEVMRDPVFTADGHTFERHVIEEWLRDHDTNPMTGKSMPSRALVPNFAIREACAAYRAQNPSNAESVMRYKEAVAKVAAAKPPALTTSDSQGASTSSTAPTFALPTDHNSSSTHTSASSVSSHLYYTSSSPSSHISPPIQPRIAPSQREGQYNDQNQFQHQGQHQRQPPVQDHHTSYGDRQQSSPPAQTQLRSQSSPTSSSSSPPSSGAQKCSLCTRDATTKKSLGGNNWIVVCDSCSAMVESQKSPSNQRFRTVSAAEAAQDALSTSIGGSSARTSGASSSPLTHSGVFTRHASSMLGNVSSSSGRGGPSMSCSHCRQQTTVSRVADIDGSQLWLCSQCADTQRQFVAAATSPSSASSHTNSTSVPRSSSIERRHTVAMTTGGGGQHRAAFLSNALGGARGIQRPPHPSSSSSSGGDGQAWNRDEAMAMLEQHEWNRANSNSANEMADRLNARYGPNSSGGSSGRRSRNRSPVPSPSGHGSGSNVGGGNGHGNGHPVNCRCGLCNRNWAVQ